MGAIRPRVTGPDAASPPLNCVKLPGEALLPVVVTCYLYFMPSDLEPTEALSTDSLTLEHHSGYGSLLLQCDGLTYLRVPCLIKLPKTFAHHDAKHHASNKGGSEDWYKASHMRQTPERWPSSHGSPQTPGRQIGTSFPEGACIKEANNRVLETTLSFGAWETFQSDRIGMELPADNLISHVAFSHDD